MTLHMATNPLIQSDSWSICMGKIWYVILLLYNIENYVSTYLNLHRYVLGAIL